MNRNSFPASGDFCRLLVTCRVWSGSKLFDALMVFLKDFVLKNLTLKKSTDDKKQTKKKHAELPSMQRVKGILVSVQYGRRVPI